MLIGALVFVVGSAGGGLFGLSYAARGTAYHWVLRARAAVGIAPPPTVVAIAPVPSAPVPTASAQQFNLDEVAVPAGSSSAEPEAESDTPPAGSSSAAPDASAQGRPAATPSAAAAGSR